MKKKALSLLLALVLVLGCLPLAAGAEETPQAWKGTWGEHGTWVLENNVVTFTSTQSEKLTACYDEAGELVYPPLGKTELIEGSWEVIIPGLDDDGRIVFGSGVTAVDATALCPASMYNLPDCSYTIPSTLLEIDNAWLLFSWTSDQAKITLDPNHPTYQFENDALIDKNKKELIKVMKTVEEEDTYAIPEGIETIGYYSLPHCKVTIPTSVTCIKVNADHDRFGGEASPYYNGTVAQWLEIENPERRSATCTDGVGECPVVTSGTCGESATWNLDKAKGKLTIGGTGSVWDYDAIRGSETGMPTAPWSFLGQGGGYFPMNSVVIEPGITRLGDNLLFFSIGGASPQTLTIPRSVTSVSEVFACCCYPKDIYFGGTEAQWNAIEVTRKTPWNQWVLGGGLDDLTIQSLFDPAKTTVHFTNIPITPNWGEVTVNPTAPFGTTNAGFATLPENGTAAFGDETVAGTYSVKDSAAIPAVGKQKVTVEFTVTGECEYKGAIFTKDYSVTVTPAQMSGTVAISGASTPAAVGDVLTAVVTTAAGASDYSIVWTRDGTEISGATGATYTITADDCGKTISAKIKAKGSSYTGEAASSDSVSVPPAAPAAPALSISTGNKRLTARWSAPADHGSAITGYTITITDGEEYSETKELEATATSYTFEELENGTLYTITLLAKNAIGSSEVVTKTAKPHVPAPSTPSGGSSDDDEPLVETDTTESGNVVTTTTQPNGDKELKVETLTGETIANIKLPADPGKGREFADVTPGSWYENAVDKATAYGLFGGESDTKFAPGKDMARGMLAQVLYNLSGKTRYGVGEGKFTDVKSGAWYRDAVDWAAKVGVTSGTGSGGFSPNQSITREQLVTMLYNYAKAIGMDRKSSVGLERFPDAGKVSGYAKEAMQWAVAEGFISGRADNGENYIAPQGTATRAEVAAVLVKFTERLK